MYHGEDKLRAQHTHDFGDIYLSPFLLWKSYKSTKFVFGLAYFVFLVAYNQNLIEHLKIELLKALKKKEKLKTKQTQT